MYKYIFLNCFIFSLISSLFSKTMIINEYPLAILYGVPVIVDPFSGDNFSLNLTHSSNSIDEYDSTDLNNYFIFDEETTKLTLSWQKSFNISYLNSVIFVQDFRYHSNGFLDNFILEWHDLWGFPQGNRKDIPVNKLKYSVKINSDQEAHLKSSRFCLGDSYLMLNTEYQFTHNKLFFTPGFSFNFTSVTDNYSSLSSKLLLQTAFQNSNILREYDGTITLYEGAVWQLKNVEGFSSFLNYGALDFEIWFNRTFGSSFTFKYHTRLLNNSDFFQLNMGTFAFSFSLNFLYNNYLNADLQFQEDFLVDTNCDFSVSLDFTYKLDRK